MSILIDLFTFLYSLQDKFLEMEMLVVKISMMLRLLMTITSLSFRVVKIYFHQQHGREPVFQYLLHQSMLQFSLILKGLMVSGLSVLVLLIAIFLNSNLELFQRDKDQLFFLKLSYLYIIWYLYAPDFLFSVLLCSY